MKPFILLLPILLYTSLAFAQKASVHIKIQNDTDKDLTVKIYKADASGSNESIVDSYKVLKKDKFETNISNNFKKLESIVAKTVINGVNFNREIKILMDRNNNFVYIIDDFKEETLKITDLLSMENILGINKDQFLIQNDFADKPIDGLYSTYLGGIVLFNPDEKKIVKEIWPSKLGYKLKYFPNTNYTEQNYLLKSNSSNTISTNVPAIAGANINFSPNSLIKTNLLIKGKKTFDLAGIDNSAMSVDEALIKLDNEIILNIGTLFLQNPKLQIKQIDRAIGIDCMVLEFEELKEISGDVSVKLASAIFEGNRTYEKTSQNRKKVLMGSSYFGFWSTNQSNAYPAFQLRSMQMATAFIQKIKNGAKDSVQNLLGIQLSENDWIRISENTKKSEYQNITKEDEARVNMYANRAILPNKLIQMQLGHIENANVIFEKLIKNEKVDKKTLEDVINKGVQFKTTRLDF